MIRVVAPSRLHFGLFHVPSPECAEVETRIFGGMGLMVDLPGVVVDVRPSSSWQFEGPLASRAQQFATRFMLGVPEERRRVFQVLVERAPTEHAGLGTGTQLGLAVGKALAAACGEGELPATELAARVGRGERSAVGVHGFDRGGLLIDAGKRPGEAVSPLMAHVGLPEAWRVVLFMPPVAGPWHGEHERRAFATALAGEARVLRKLVDEAILPAARAGNLDAFGEAVHEFNRKAGEPFAAAQGGAYATREVEDLIADVRTWGVSGVGQSSWGPTVFAITPDSDNAVSLAKAFRGRMPAFVSRISLGHSMEEAE